MVVGAAAGEREGVVEGVVERCQMKAVAVRDSRWMEAAEE